MPARLARANELAVVRVPGPVDEAMRDLVRAREPSADPRETTPQPNAPPSGSAVVYLICSMANMEVTSASSAPWISAL
jgi:hypothetical protein